ncbi:uncharacterized protein [Primulina huaijiensis]|uniref:uncharacterized protein n=1 Tax=Primulina huaijiensis TaxID=1492673 RepID=UPI003CC72DFA
MGWLPVKNYEVKDFAECVALLPGACELHLDEKDADKLYGPILDSLEQVRTKKPFKIFNMWALSEKFGDIVEKHWHFEGHGTWQYRLKQMLKRLRPLLGFNAKQFSGISARAEAARTKSVPMQTSMLSVGVMPDEYLKVRKSTDLLVEVERSLIAQKAKCNYLRQGDRRTKFIHDLIKINSKMKAIVAIRRNDGTTTCNPLEISEQFVECYKAILGCKAVRTTMQHPVTIEEVRASLFDIDNDKAPGILYQWTFFEAMEPHNYCLSSKICGCIIVNDYRPISCCTVLYKIISKVLVERMRRVIGGIVNEAQASFIQGRSIVDSIHVAQELLRKYARYGWFENENFKFRAALFDIDNDKAPGKLELIRSVIQVVNCYWLSILPIPVNIFDIIYSLCEKFLWPSKRPPIAWKSLYKPVDDGGWGLKNLHAWNQALICKTLWKIHLKKDNMWIKWVYHKYGKYGALGSTDGAIMCLSIWFGKATCLKYVYDFFGLKVGRWPLKPLISKTFILQKHKFILWLFAHTKLLTWYRLGPRQDESCALCKAVSESGAHLFFSCWISKNIWDEVRNWLDMKKKMGSAAAVL